MQWVLKIHSDSCSSKAFSTKASLQPFFALTQLNFKPLTPSNFSVCLQNSVEIGSPQDHFSFFSLQSWQIWWSFMQRYHCRFPGLAGSPQIWHTMSFRIPVTVLLQSSRNEAIFTNFRFSEFPKFSTSHECLQSKFSKSRVGCARQVSAQQKQHRLRDSIQYLCAQRNIPDRTISKVFLTICWSSQQFVKVNTLSREFRH